jgi:cell division transport system permease protein
MFRIFRHFKEAFLGLIRHMAMTLSSISSITVTLLFVSVFLLVSINVQQFTYGIEETVNIHVKILQTHETQQDLNLIYDQISVIPGVEEIVFSSKDDELDKFIESFGEEGAIFENYRGESNPLRMAYLVNIQQGEDVEAVSASIRQIEGIEAVQYGGVRVLELMELLTSVRNGVYALVAGLALVALFLISNTIKLSIATRQREITIMRTVGAKNWFIRMPFIIEGSLIGFFGSLLPVGLTIAGYYFLFDFLGGELLTPMFQLIEPVPLVLYLSGILVLVAIAVGSLGSYMAVAKHLRWKR